LIVERLYLIATEPNRLGWLVCALDHKVCRENNAVFYQRSRLFADFAIAHGDAHYARLLRSRARAESLIISD